MSARRRGASNDRADDRVGDGTDRGSMSVELVIIAPAAKMRRIPVNTAPQIRVPQQQSVRWRVTLQ